MGFDQIENLREAIRKCKADIARIELAITTPPPTTVNGMPFRRSANALQQLHLDRVKGYERLADLEQGLALELSRIAPTAEAKEEMLAKARAINRKIALGQVVPAITGGWMAQMRLSTDDAVVTQTSEQPPQTPTRTPVPVTLPKEVRVAERQLDWHEWHELRECFSALAAEEKSILSGKSNGVHATVDARSSETQTVRSWTLYQGASDDIRARFQALAARAADELGSAPEGSSKLDYWLESLFHDLLKRKKEGGKARGLLCAENQNDGCIIEWVCPESATYCSRLEAKAREQMTRFQARSTNRNDAQGIEVPKSRFAQMRSSIRRAIAWVLIRTPEASDRDVCRMLDDQASEELPKGWRRGNNRSFEAAYADPATKNRVEKTISKVRVELRKRNLPW